jgi:predicted O-methyltransferase YrrM
MKNINVSFELLSNIVWQRLLDSSAYKAYYQKSDFFKKIDSLEELRKHADYNTGSISSSSAWLLYSAAHYFYPAKILEVGTFIGKSALSLALGAENAPAGCEIHTCDSSNDIDLPALSRTKIVQYKKSTSTDMFRKISGSHQAQQFDFMHLDGRLQPEDFSLLQKLLHPDAVIALDDFEGIEKGVTNLIKLRENKLLTSHIVVYPCSKDLLSAHHLVDRSTTALLIPSRMLQLTAQ